jgi:hypothetical protein
MSYTDRIYTIPPKPVWYMGAECRSTTEGRWAVVIDIIKWRWIHEPPIIYTAYGGYCPDFFVPALEMYLEIKPSAPTALEEGKARGAARKTGLTVAFLAGPPCFSSEVFVTYNGEPLELRGISEFFRECGVGHYPLTEAFLAACKYRFDPPPSNDNSPLVPVAPVTRTMEMPFIPANDNKVQTELDLFIARR